MKIEYSLLALFMALVYGLIKAYAPDFPLDEKTLLVLLVYVLLKLGVEIIGKPLVVALFAAVRKMFVRK